MSLRYSHTLIPISKSFLPTAAQVQAFIAEMPVIGAMGGEPSIALRTPSRETQQVRNPITGELEFLRKTDLTKVPLITRIAELVAPLDDYQIEVSGMGRPRTPPLPLNFDDPYHVAVNCVVHPDFRTLSDLHEESGAEIELPFFDTPCECNDEEGLFSNPHRQEIIRVPFAACARFWIQFELGNDVFPEFAKGDLMLLNPVLLGVAEHTFGIEFVQGCYWG